MRVTDFQPMWHFPRSLLGTSDKAEEGAGDSPARCSVGSRWTSGPNDAQRCRPERTLTRSGSSKELLLVKAADGRHKPENIS